MFNAFVVILIAIVFALFLNFDSIKEYLPIGRCSPKSEATYTPPVES